MNFLVRVTFGVGQALDTRFALRFFLLILGVRLSSVILRFSHFRWLLDTLHYYSTHDPGLPGVFLSMDGSKDGWSHDALYFTWLPDERGFHQTPIFVMPAGDYRRLIRPSYFDELSEMYCHYSQALSVS